MKTRAKPNTLDPIVLTQRQAKALSVVLKGIDDEYLADMLIEGIDEEAMPYLTELEDAITKLNTHRL